MTGGLKLLQMTVDRFKAKLVAQGYTQEYDLEY